jgi:hypothetical protein
VCPVQDMIEGQSVINKEKIAILTQSKDSNSQMDHGGSVKEIELAIGALVMVVMNVSFLLFFFFDMRLSYDFHFTYPDMSLPAGVHESPNTCTTCVCLMVNTLFPTV